MTKRFEKVKTTPNTAIAEYNFNTLRQIRAICLLPKDGISFTDKEVFIVAHLHDVVDQSLRYSAYQKARMPITFWDEIDQVNVDSMVEAFDQEFHPTQDRVRVFQYTMGEIIKKLTGLK